MHEKNKRSHSIRQCVRTLFSAQLVDLDGERRARVVSTKLFTFLSAPFLSRSPLPSLFPLSFAAIRIESRKSVSCIRARARGWRPPSKRTTINMQFTQITSIGERQTVQKRNEDESESEIIIRNREEGESIHSRWNGKLKRKIRSRVLATEVHRDELTRSASRTF